VGIEQEPNISNTNETELALLSVLRPLIELCLARGIKFQALSDLTKLAYVQQATRNAAASKPNVSQISVATGVHRKDVNRLLGEQASNQTPMFPRSIESEVFHCWVTHKLYSDETGQPKLLERQSKSAGDASFETLCWQITKDVHPRSVLESMVRLNLVSELEDGRLALTKNSFVPSNEEKQMLALLAGNLSDHIQAAVSNVGKQQPPYLEQAVFGRNLSHDGVEKLHQLSRTQWSQFTQQLMNLIVQLPESQDDAKPTTDNHQRFRVGMYFFSETDPTQSTKQASK
jgi:hypothetical protein